LELKEEKSLLLYNPQKELPLNLELAGDFGDYFHQKIPRIVLERGRLYYFFKRRQ
jgi:hypothetical protein